MRQYSLIWTCWDCGTDNTKMLTKYHAAFHEALKLQKTFKCRKCGHRKARSSACILPHPDDPELLEAWLADKKLFFLSQDEELFLMEIRAKVLIGLIENDKTPRHRRGVLSAALHQKIKGGVFDNVEDEKIAREYFESNSRGAK